MSQPAPNSNSTAKSSPDIFHHVMGAEMLARLLRVAVQIKLAESVSKEPRTIDDLSRELGLRAEPLGRLMRALVANGIFREAPADHFGHNANSERLREDHPKSAAAILSLNGLPSNNGAWAGLPGALQSGKPPFEVAFGQKLYPYLATHTDESRIFNRAMVDNTAIVVEAVVGAWAGFKAKQRVLDVGGGFGQMLAGIVRRHGHLSGDVFDQGHLENSCRAYLAQQSLADRCAFVAGDFLKSLPEGYGIYLVKNVLWNWNDEDVTKILTNAARAMRSQADARVLIVETLLGEGDAAWASLLDVQMLVMPNGRSRSRRQYDALAHRAGLTPAETCRANPQTSLLSYKLS